MELLIYSGASPFSYPSRVSQAEASQTSEAVSQAAGSLVQLCALLPAGAAAFGDAPVGAEPKRRAAEVEAGAAVTVTVPVDIVWLDGGGEGEAVGYGW